MDKKIARRPEREGYARRGGFAGKPMVWKGGLGAPRLAPVPLGTGKLQDAADTLKKRRRDIDDAVDSMSG